MRYIADLHVHSRYSRACSKNLVLPNMAAWAATKGIDVLATADFTHPKWLKEIEEKMEPAAPGLFRLRKGFAEEVVGSGYRAALRPPEPRPVSFILSTELSCIYKKGGRTRRLHLVLLAPSIEAVKILIAEFERRKFNLASDGRPILGLDAKELLKIVLDIDRDFLLIPAHAWTPWFAVFGSESGFDSLEECFDELAPEICAIETGLSSDPPMNWRVSGLDNAMLVSNSDAHGLENLGREANVFDWPEASYPALLKTLRQRDRKSFLYTIEFFPEEGKYHVDGHRACGFSCLPRETKRLKGLCPKCSKELVRGVLGRVEALADRREGERPRGAVDFRRIVPLAEVLGDVLDKGAATKAVRSVYDRLITKVGSEFAVLLDAEPAAIAAQSDARVAEAIERMRRGDVTIAPGYDGVFGTVKLLGSSRKAKQGALDI
ncbi:MAG: endonuclease Q family protein [Patescibacteria group bacterium]|nr:endonuclease Q family protein [Patescibacteria group bacterium]